MARQIGEYAMKRSIFALSLVAFLAACGTPEAATAQVDKLEVKQVVIRLAPVQGRPSAGYFTLHGGKTADRLTAVSSPKTTKIELHESRMEGGVMRMRPLTGVEIPAGGSVVFKPGGNHAMLFGVDPSVKPGSVMPLRFVFGSGSSIDAQAKVIGVGDDMPMNHDGH